MHDAAIDLDDEAPLLGQDQKSLLETNEHLLSWHNVSLSVPEEETSFFDHWSFRAKEKKREKDLLHNVFGVARPGEVSAILGPSGAGKSSLLNVLAGRNLRGLVVSGSVKVDGAVVDEERMRRLSAYVQQEDLFVGALTVKEHLQFHARLRMPRYSKKEQEERVEEVIRDLGLEPCENTVIATRHRHLLSGGERKRLAFASEILTSPPILLVDEPTSGLDAFLALQVLTILRDLVARKAMTVVLTIHQPSSQIFELFHSVNFLAGGRLAFSGRREDAVAFWSQLGSPVPKNFNPADHFLSTLARRRSNEGEGREVDKICAAFDASPWALEARSLALASSFSVGTSSSDDAERGLNEKGKGRRRRGRRESRTAGWGVQLQCLLQRNALCMLREPMLLKVQLMQTILIGLLTGFIYSGSSLSQATIMNINGAAFQLIANMNFMYQHTVLNHICLELPVLQRESGDGLYRVSAFFAAKNLVELPYYSFLSFLFAAIMYWLCGFVPSLDAFLVFSLISVLACNYAVSVGYAAAAAFGTVALANAVLPVFVIPFLAFAGFFINIETLPVVFRPLAWISHFKLSFESLVINQWSRIDHIPGCEGNSSSSTLSSPCLSTGADVVASLGFAEWHEILDLSLLAGLIVVVRLLAYFALLLRSRR